MADFTNTRNRSNLGWIIAAIVVVLVLLYVFFGGGSAPTDSEAVFGTGESPAAQSTPAETNTPVPAPAD